MEGEAFLTDLLDVSQFELGTLNVIVAPCGCGKTTCAINKIAPLASQPKKALYLIDTRNGFERLAQEEELIKPYLWYDDAIDGDCLLNYPDKVVVATYARFGMWVENYPNFADNFEIIICDEAHNLVQFATFSPEPNNASRARDAIKKAVFRRKTKVIAITATSDYLHKLQCHQKEIFIANKEKLYHYSEKRIVRYACISQVLEQIPSGKIGGLYVARIEQMKQFEAFARSCGRKPICVWSLSNSKHPMNEEQLQVREYILENEEVPPKYDLFIFNASSETALNIRSHTDYFVSHNSENTHIKQARGRFRSDIETLYILDKEHGCFTVPKKYLNHPLFKEEKDALRAELDIKNDKGRYIPWKELSQRLTDNGYTFAEGRKDNRPYIQITKLNDC